MPNDNDFVSRFNTNTQNFGLEPLKTPLTVDEKKLSALMLATQAAVAQFVSEGIFNQGDQVHFMIHLQDFMARLYAGEVLQINGVAQTLDINSSIGKIFLDAANDGLVNGKENVENLKEAIAQAVAAQEANKQTSLDGETPPKPKWLN